MPLYESVFIARQDVSGPQVEGLADTLVKAIEDQGGKVTKRETWGLRPLSFRIKKNRKGHYVMLNIDAPPAAVVEYERLMRYNEDVLRYMTVRVEDLEEGPSAILQSRSSRDDRGGRRGDRDRGDRDRGDRDRGDRDRGDRDRGDRDRGDRDRGGRDRGDRDRGDRDVAVVGDIDSAGGEE